MSGTILLRIAQGDTLLAAPRRIWLAALGAAAVTRHWAETNAGTTFRALVREGAAVESKAIRGVSERMDASVRRIARGARRARDEAASIATTILRSAIRPQRARADVQSAPARGAHHLRRKTAKRAARRSATSRAK